MTRQKTRQNQPGEIALGKPDFEQALSFAESMQHEGAARLPGPMSKLPEPAPVISGRNMAELPVRAAMHQSASALMPQDEETRKLLEERALAIARPAVQRQHESRNQYLRFRLGAVELYGIPYQYLEELSYVGNLARVPCTPAFVSGVVNHRGELLTILDLKQFFRMQAIDMGDDARIIVVKHADVRVGLLVDAVDGNEEYQDSELFPPLSSEGVSNMEYVLGIHAGNVTLLNLKALLSDPALLINR